MPRVAVFHEDIRRWRYRNDRTFGKLRVGCGFETVTLVVTTNGRSAPTTSGGQSVVVSCLRDYLGLLNR